MTASTMPDPAPVVPGDQGLPDTGCHSFSPEELYFFDDIMAEVGLFMDVAMTEPSIEIPKLNSNWKPAHAVPVSPCSSSSGASVVSEASTGYLYDSAPPAVVSPSSSSSDLRRQSDFSVPNPIASLDQAPPVIESRDATQTAPPRASVTVKISSKTASTKEKRRTVASKVTQSPKKRRAPPAKEVDPTDKQELARRHRNREHAKRSRLRKKSLTQTLEQSAQDLKDENEYLRNKVYAKFGKELTDEMVKVRTVHPTEKFIMALKQPGNTMLNQSSLAFLKSLSDSTRASMAC